MHAHFWTNKKLLIKTTKGCTYFFWANNQIIDKHGTFIRFDGLDIPKESKKAKPLRHQIIYSFRLSEHMDSAYRIYSFRLTEHMDSAYRICSPQNCRTNESSILFCFSSIHQFALLCIVLCSARVSRVVIQI